MNTFELTIHSLAQPLEYPFNSYLTSLTHNFIVSGIYMSYLQVSVVSQWIEFFTCCSLSGECDR